MKIEKEERQRAKIKRQSLESAVEEKIKRQLQNVFGRAEVSYDFTEILLLNTIYYCAFVIGKNQCFYHVICM